jgi:Fe-S cluster biogenesis protein NfuA
MTTEELTSNVLLALDEIRPFLNSDGGDITPISIEDDKHV